MVRRITSQEQMGIGERWWIGVGKYMDVARLIVLGKELGEGEVRGVRGSIEDRERRV